MKSRLKEGGIATFWLPINQLKVKNQRRFFARFTMRFPTP